MRFKVGNTLTEDRDQLEFDAGPGVSLGLTDAATGNAFLSITGSNPVINAKTDYGAKCDWNGSTGTDDTTAIQNALTAGASSGLPVLLPGRSKITNSLSIGSSTGLIGYSPGFSLGSVNDPAFTPRSQLVWAGASGGTMISITQAQSVIVDGIGLDGGNHTVAKGIYCQSMQGSVIRRVDMRKMGVTASPTTSGVGLWLEGSSNAGTGWNLFEQLTIAASQIMKLTAVSGTAGAADAFANTFTRINGTYGSTSGNEDGVWLDCADNNEFVGLYLFHTLGTGYGLTFGTRARNNYFFHPYTSSTGVHAMTPVTAGWGNTIVGMQRNDSTPFPVIDTGATLQFSENSFGTGTYLARPIRMPVFTPAIPAGGGNIVPDGSKSDCQAIVFPDNNVYTINNITQGAPAGYSQGMTVKLTNSSGGALTNTTFNGGWIFNSAVAFPANGKSKLYYFRGGGDLNELVEVNRSADYTP